MKFNSIPQAQGLYNPSFEKDACGIGAIAHIKGKKSHHIIKDVLDILVKLEHRGGAGAEKNTGDGAGILIQLPHKFFKKQQLGFNIGEEGDYAVAMMFLPVDENDRNKAKKVFEKAMESEGLKFLGWREVPVNPSNLGETALEAMPHIIQGFVERPKDIEKGQAFERKLYVARRVAEKEATKVLQDKTFYVCSFSSKTIVYKGMLLSTQVEEFFLDLQDEDMESAIGMVHSRFSTNTFPSWERAHPNRCMIHNGEINTIRGNANWIHTREDRFESDVFKDDLKKILPVIDREGSDSAMFDNTLEFLVMNGRSLPETVMMLIPEPWSKNKEMDKKKRDFYEYQSTLMEPWDGPAAIVFTDGDIMGASLDRNGLRPARYYVTNDDYLILSSEVGVLDIPEENIKEKQRLHPGRMLLVDTVKGEVIDDKTLKEQYASAKPYGEWLEKNLVKIENISSEEYKEESFDESKRLILQRNFGYTYDELTSAILPMSEKGEEALAAMGVDTPLAVLSDRPQPLYNYFKQLFAQVTNPPIDAIREVIVTSSRMYLGPEGNLLNPNEENCRRVKLTSPIISNEEMYKVLNLGKQGFKVEVLPIVFDAKSGDLKKALDDLFAKADKAIENGATILILSDRNVDENNVGIPALLATSGLHQHLIRTTKRTSVSIVLESGEPREIHHFATLLGFGVNAVNPYLAFETISDLVEKGMLKDTYEHGVKNYIKACNKGIVKILSKMGISTIQSYNGAQIFEAIGISKEVVDEYFTSTACRIDGVGLKEIAEETLRRHKNAFDELSVEVTLDSEGSHKYRSHKEEHLYNPLTIHKLQNSCRNKDYKEFKEYTAMLSGDERVINLRNIIDFDYSGESIPLDEVEPVESIVKRFKTGAMSYGSISKEAHECLAIAMNRIGGKSNTGEGGEERERFVKDANGDSRSSAIKQVASGRFGVTAEYLVNAKEIQIKMAQGAKPGEGGQLPAKKVYPWVAKARHSTTGVGLISPPPHHDIYSIEDLAQLIYDLKNANRDARISVKLVSEAGVGTVAAGVAKAGAEVILISGYDGGTGASPRTSIANAGLPWELGLAETHQTLVMNKLRDRVVIETDGKLMTGRDLAVAALLGAEEYGFATAPLVVMGCVMMRVCNLDTCPVGIATQNTELRKRFKGNPDHVVNFMTFIAMELREYMAKLGFRTVEEMIGRTDKLKVKKDVKGWKAKKVDLEKVLHNPSIPQGVAVSCKHPQPINLENTIDLQVLVPKCKAAIEKGEKVSFEVDVKNTDRSFATILSSEVTKVYGQDGLPKDTIHIKANGAGGNSFGAFVNNGITLEIEGDCNDYLGKGLCGGKISVYPHKNSTIVAEDNIIAGNVTLYGATSGEVYINGIAGERFAVRNSGAIAVVEGVGDHGCEYMTGGRVVVIGEIGRNFAAGMSGGIAYILDETGNNKGKINTDMVDLQELSSDDIEEVKSILEAHVENTNSNKGKSVLENFEALANKFIKVMPRDYNRMITTIKELEGEGYSRAEAELAAFEKNNALNTK
ncbi:glutamate synthase large subunit [Clostridium bornimense]|uniref:glutamate synthase large subunit n=1 Tax=Clostridium bornimense TaxID=1216932 RepID=UPI001C11AD49|nr:glutamate synthase large subunit [Clostridium bornimense]MBU5317488.1 glutamate synthase large subunit [Clostridium bornimense]